MLFEYCPFYMWTRYISVKFNELIKVRIFFGFVWYTFFYMKPNEIFLYFCTYQQKLKNWSFANFFYIFFIFTWSLLHLVKKKNYLYVGHYLSVIFNSNLTDKKKQIRKQLLIKLRKIISQSLIEDIFETILDKSVDAHAIRIL